MHGHMNEKSSKNIPFLPRCKHVNWLWKQISAVQWNNRCSGVDTEHVSTVSG